MDLVLNILVALLVFGLLIFVHELGHFLAARWAGITIYEFSLGMGPPILKWKRRGTQYALRLFPIGGYVKMAGEDEISEDENAFNKKPWHKRFIVLAAGAIMNLVLGLVLMTVYVGTNPIGVPTTRIVLLDESDISRQAGMQAGDELVRIDGYRVRTELDLQFSLMRSKGETVDIDVLRDGKIVKLGGIKYPRESLGDGVSAIKIDFKILAVKKKPLNVLSYSFKNTASVVKVVWFSLIDLVTGRAGFNQISGPVGTTQAIGDAAGEAVKNLDLTPLLFITLLITINLGVFNLLPLPALDGGRLLFLLIEGVRRKPLDPEKEGIVHFIGFALLILLLIAVTFNDIMRLFGK